MLSRDGCIAVHSSCSRVIHSWTTVCLPYWIITKLVEIVLLLVVDVHHMNSSLSSTRGRERCTSSCTDVRAVDIAVSCRFVVSVGCAKPHHETIVPRSSLPPHVSDASTAPWCVASVAGGHAARERAANDVRAECSTDHRTDCPTHDRTWRRTTSGLPRHNDICARNVGPDCTVVMYPKRHRRFLPRCFCGACLWVPG